jgi:hypothetical protein
MDLREQKDFVRGYLLAQAALQPEGGAREKYTTEVISAFDGLMDDGALAEVKRIVDVFKSNNNPLMIKGDEMRDAKAEYFGHVMHVVSEHDKGRDVRPTVADVKPEYKVISRDSVRKLEGSVSSLMADGWTPVGGVCNNDGKYSQAMTRGEANDQG